MKKLALFALPLLAIGCTSPQQPKETNLNVMTFNIRYDNPQDGLNNWNNRKNEVAQTIRFADADVVGTQEVLANQLKDLKSELPEYETVGVGREDGIEKGEYSALFFKSGKYDLLDSGNFWLSENPEAVGEKGWDAACERIVTWAKLKDKESGITFYAFNTHFDHVGRVARQKSVALLLNRINEYAGDAPVIVTGDFNAEPASGVVRDMIDKSNQNAVKDSRSLSPVIAGPGWTFHDFGKLPMERRDIIDYVFVKNSVDVNRYGVIHAQIDSMFISDHNPILVNLTLR